MVSAFLMSLLILAGCGDSERYRDLREDFLEPPNQAKPWVFWYWMNAAVSEEAITADLEAMKEAGIGGAVMFAIRGPQDPPQYEPPAIQLSPRWWDLVIHAMKEADRVGLEMGLHACDGFAVAGGPWIRPEYSMQKVVWTETMVKGGSMQDILLEQPETNEGYYRDIAVYAFPTVEDAWMTTDRLAPEVSSSIPGMDPGFLASAGSNGEQFLSMDSCWIQYSFDSPFTCRNISIRTLGYNYPAHRLWLQCSDDGIEYRTICRLEPPRHGWQEDSTPVNYAIEPTTARYFRFIHSVRDLEPGSEDLEMAKWSPGLEIAGIRLSGAPRIHHYRAKTAAVWRIGTPTTEEQIPDSLCIPKGDILDLTALVDSGGLLQWEVPAGDWTVLRMGHTSTGKTNYTGGGGLGLECDKFNPEAARIQFDNWFGAIADSLGEELAGRVLKIFHVDSWECGSQNWSPVFREEFIRRRGYDPLPMLPAMAGIPVGGLAGSEEFLHDMRKTISELVIDNFYDVFAESAHEYGCSFSAECTAPTMTGDGMLHYSSVDLPMGEFWIWSPTHDKPNDIMDAVSGAHIYGKNLVQAEAFTQRILNWAEHPAQLKVIGDRNFAQGINRFAYHVFAHNPWMDRKPGMTLSRIGLYFQRDQTWWEQGRAWVEYHSRCQALLQKGVHVADIAVFTGEDIPARAVLPDRLVPLLPGIFGEEVVLAEKKRLANVGAPRRELPAGVIASANIANPGDWTDALRGYKYDSFNPDVLLNRARVKNGRIVLPGGASYALLVLPGARRMDPGGNVLSDRTAGKIRELVEAGAAILIPETLRTRSGVTFLEFSGAEVLEGSLNKYRAGKGIIYIAPWEEESFSQAGIEPDLLALEKSGERAGDIAWTHRRLNGREIYFFSNQLPEHRNLTVSLRASGFWPDLYDPLSGEIYPATTWQVSGGRTEIPLKLDPNGSIFIALENTTGQTGMEGGANMPEPVAFMELEGDWKVRFDTLLGGPASPVEMKELQGWHLSEDPGIRYYSGTAVYSRSFTWKGSAEESSRYWLAIGGLHNLADVYLNGKSCGVIWTHPYRIGIAEFLKDGENHLEIHVSNTWTNRMMGDLSLSPEKRISWTTDPVFFGERQLESAGITGNVTIYKQ
jgi:hypothetical protein